MSKVGSSSSRGKLVDGKIAGDGEIHVNLSPRLYRLDAVVIIVPGSRGCVHGASLLSG